MELKISVEKLAHFQCSRCAKWWSIGDAPLNRWYYCPWCGCRQFAPHPITNDSPPAAEPEQK